MHMVSILAYTYKRRYDFIPRNISSLFFPADANVHAGFFKVFYKVRRKDHT